MQVDFIQNSNNANQYYVRKDGSHVLTAAFNKKNGSKELYNRNDTLVAEGFPYSLKKFQFIPYYVINLYRDENITILIRHKTWLQSILHFEYKSSYYQTLCHFGYKYSIFKDNEQIGYYQTGGDGILSGNMRLILNHDADHEMMCMLCLRLYSNFHGESAEEKPAYKVTIGSKRFDRNWKPTWK